LCDSDNNNRGLAYAGSDNTQQAKKDLQTAAQLFRQQGKITDHGKAIQILQQL
jgi:hypothetical protein